MESAWPKKRQVTAGKAHLDFLYYAGEGPAIVLLHATGFNPWLWHPISRELAPANTVIAPFFCEPYQEKDKSERQDWVDMAERLAESCNALALVDPIIVGHSMGGTIAVIAQTLFGLHARGIILLEPIFLPPAVYRMNLTVNEHPLAAKSLNRRNFWKNEEEALSYLLSRKLFNTWDREIVELYMEHGMKKEKNGNLSLSCPPRKEASLFMGGVTFDPWPLLSKIDCPVLIVEGDKSENRNFIDLQEVSSRIPNSDYTRMTSAGHLIPMEIPRETAALIEGFVRSLG